MDKTTLLLISIFLGGLGVDHFAVGRIGTGILKLITGGGFGIWWIIDIVMIARGTFVDASGRPIA